MTSDKVLVSNLAFNAPMVNSSEGSEVARHDVSDLLMDSSATGGRVAPEPVAKCIRVVPSTHVADLE